MEIISLAIHRGKTNTRVTISDQEEDSRFELSVLVDCQITFTSI